MNTLKALASSSPGFALKPWVRRGRKKTLRNSEGIAKSFAVKKPRRNSFRFASSRNECVFPGLPKRNPGLELANAFSVIHRRPSESIHSLTIPHVTFPPPQHSNLSFAETFLLLIRLHPSPLPLGEGWSLDI